MITHWVDSLTGGNTHKLFVDHYHLRKEVFIDGFGWDLSSRGTAEIDQYDTPFANYCLLEDQGQLIACARVLPTTFEMGGTSYMIRDAFLGRLGNNLPPEICADFTPPVSENTWEATRLAVAPQLSKQKKKQALNAIVGRMVYEANTCGVGDILAIGGVELLIGVRAAGFDIRRVTPMHSTSSGKIAIFQLHTSIYKLTHPPINGKAVLNTIGDSHANTHRDPPDPRTPALLPADP